MIVSITALPLRLPLLLPPLLKLISSKSLSFGMDVVAIAAEAAISIATLCLRGDRPLGKPALTVGNTLVLLGRTCCLSLSGLRVSAATAA